MKRSSPLRWVLWPAAVLACGVLAVGCGSGQSHTSRARVVRLGSLTMKLPAGWHVRRVQGTCGRAAGPGILIADLSQRQLRSIHHPRLVNGCTTISGCRGSARRTRWPRSTPLGSRSVPGGAASRSDWTNLWPLVVARVSAQSMTGPSLRAVATPAVTTSAGTSARTHQWRNGSSSLLSSPRLRPRTAASR